MIELARMRNIVFLYGQFPSLFLLHKSKKIIIKEKLIYFKNAISEIYAKKRLFSAYIVLGTEPSKGPEGH